MNKDLESRLSKDLQIVPYDGELNTYYQSRLIYSALSIWMKYLIFDRTTDHFSQKSKSYILRRGRTILDSFISNSVSQQQWFSDDELNDYNSNSAIVEIRNRMLAAGELVELFPNNDVTVATQMEIPIGDGISRILGMPAQLTPQMKMAGISCIKETPNINDSIHSKLEIESYLDWILKTAKWSNINTTDGFEFFNPYSKQSPYKSWVDFPVNDEQIYLCRKTLFNDMHEYYLLKNVKGIWQNAPLIDALSEKKEERRIILGLRKKCGNPAIAEYISKGSCIDLKLHCRLPLADEAYIETLCWPKRYYKDKTNYIVPSEVWPSVKKQLEISLGIITEEHSNG